MNRPWLSILIPVFNVEPYIEECLDSVLQQVDAGVEVIILDDMSTDGSFKLVHTIAARSNHPVRIYQHAANRGLSAARNTLVTQAQGDYVWFLDSDDALGEGSIAQLRNVVTQHSPDLVICDYAIWKPGNTRSPFKYQTAFGVEAGRLLSEPGKLFQGLYRFGKLHAWSKISKRHLWDCTLAFPEGRYFEDIYTTPRLALRANTFFYVASSWIYYRQREGSILSSFTPKKVEDMLFGLEGVQEAWLTRVPNLSFRARYYFIRYCVKVFFYAAKESQRMGAQFSLASPDVKQRLFKIIGMGRKGLIKYYLLNGDIFRLIKILKQLS